VLPRKSGSSTAWLPGNKSKESSKLTALRSDCYRTRKCESNRSFLGPRFAAFKRRLINLGPLGPIPKC
jgi:hypothetical protein